MQNSYDNNQAEYEYAGFWVRSAAYLIDSIIVFAALLVVRLMMSGFMAAVKGTVLGGNILFQYNLKDIVLYAAEVFYFILCTYYTGTTLGKRAMNLRVVRADEGEKLELLTVIYRETVGRFLCSVIMGIGYLMVGVDKEKRGIHDILCDTRVIYAKKIKVFKMEQTFIPLAEPMGRFHGQETDLQEKMPANNSLMPWDAPYMSKGNVQESQMQADDIDTTPEKEDTTSDN